MKKKLLVTLLAVVAGQSLFAQVKVTVDPRDPAAFHTLREAVAVLKPGDTLWLAPGSGPYREELFIRASGAEGAPVIVEGNGNEVTGFDPLVFENGVAQSPVDYPFVLRHNGKRVPEETSGQFGPGVSYDAATNRLTLAPDASPEGWEISVRKFAVRIHNASHQSYRQLVASGSLNDGFNLHGSGEHLEFIGITGCQNLDEGFSAHDTIHSEIRGGRFYENDNGLLNGAQTRTRLEKVDFRDNLGLGLGFNGEATVEAQEVRVWGNGLVQVLLRNAVKARLDGVEVWPNPYKARRWITYNETARWNTSSNVKIDESVTLESEQPVVQDAGAPLPQPSL